MSLVLGARGRLSYSSTCCLSPGVLREALGNSQDSYCQCDDICMAKFYTEVIS